MASKKREEYKTIQRFCIECGSELDLPVPKKEKGALIYCCPMCSLPHTICYVEDNKNYPSVVKIAISINFEIYKKEMDDPEAKLYSSFFADKRKEMNKGEILS